MIIATFDSEINLHVVHLPFNQNSNNNNVIHSKFVIIKNWTKERKKHSIYIPICKPIQISVQLVQYYFKSNSRSLKSSSQD